MEWASSEDWDLAGILSDICSAASPTPTRRSPLPSSSWPWLPSSQLPPPSMNHPSYPMIPIHHHSPDYAAYSLSIDMSAMPPPSVDQRSESPPPVETVSSTLTESAIEEDSLQKKAAAETDGAGEKGAGMEEEREETERRRRGEEEAARPPVQQERGWNWFALLPTSLWRKVGPEMASKIDENDPHALQLLRYLTEREGIDQRMLSAQRLRVRRRRGEIFDTLETYSVLQGVIYAAVADTTIFTRNDVWAPCLLIVIVALASIFGIYDRYTQLVRHYRLLRRMEFQKQQIGSVTEQLKKRVLHMDGADHDTSDLETLSKKIPCSLYCLQIDDGTVTEGESPPIAKLHHLVALLFSTVAVAVFVSCYHMLSSHPS